MAKTIRTSALTGRVTKRTINGRIYYYHEWKEGDTRRSRTISQEEYEELKDSLAERRILQKSKPIIQENYGMTVLTHDALRDFISPAASYRKRDCYKELEKYLYGNTRGKILILYGLRRTGKTTLIRQALLNMNEEDFSRSAFIQARVGDTISKLEEDLKKLKERGYKFVFIDEATFLSDFLSGAEILSDLYSASGLKIVLSGTDSLGFWLSAKDHLYDRAHFIHTTFIPYSEFERVLGIKGIDHYIAYGGTMSIEGARYNDELILRDSKEYLDTAVVSNIQHSLKLANSEFSSLKELYEAGELSSAINWLIEDMNRDFTLTSLSSDFLSHDLGISAHNLRKDRLSPSDVLDSIDKEAFLIRLKAALSLLDPKERKVPLTEKHIKELKEYLLRLDFLGEIEIVSLPCPLKRRKYYSYLQPSIRYSEAKELVNAIFLDPQFDEYSEREITILQNRILSEIEGRMMEDIVLLESQRFSSGEKVFKLEFPDGEFDMVKSFDGGLYSEIYEIKFSNIRIPEQTLHLRDEAKCRLTAKKFGEVVKKTVIYRGENAKEGEIEYMNVEDYLNSLRH